MCGWVGGGCVACKIIVSAPVPVPFLWTLDLDLGPGFGTWIWDLDLGLELGLTTILARILMAPGTLI